MFLPKIVNNKKKPNIASRVAVRAQRSLRGALLAPLAFAFFWGVFFTGRALSQDVLSIDFPVDNKKDSAPLGLREWPVFHQNEIEIPLTPLNDEGSVLVSVIFEDSEAQSIKAKWRANSEYTTLLMDNISDGVAGLNQRTFEVGFELLAQAGSLVLEVAGGPRAVKRVVLTWTWPTGVFTSASTQGIRYIAPGNRVYAEQDFLGTSSGVTADTWSNGVWRAILQEQIEPLDEAIQFSVPMDAVPRAAIFRTKVFGLPLDALVSVWVNGREVKPLLFEVPSLSGAGYFQKGSGNLGYAGWREAALVIPPDHLVSGENSITLGAHGGAYLKDSLLELNFEDEGTPLVLESGASPSPAGYISSPGAGTVASRHIQIQEPSVVVTPEAGGLPVVQVFRAPSAVNEPIVVVARPDPL